MTVKFFDLKSQGVVKLDDVAYIDLYPDGVDVFFKSGQNIFFEDDKYSLINAAD